MDVPGVNVPLSPALLNEAACCWVARRKPSLSSRCEAGGEFLRAPNTKKHAGALCTQCCSSADPHAAEPVAVLVALQLADELSAAGSQAGDDGFDVLDDEYDLADPRR